jgi:hypothetical protein
MKTEENIRKKTRTGKQTSYPADSTKYDVKGGTKWMEIQCTI